MRGLFSNGLRPRALFLAMIFLAWFAVVLGRLVQLQVVNHARLKAEVVEQSQNEMVVFPKRGTIFDRNGKILARSLPADSIYFSPAKGEAAARQMDEIGRLRKLLDLSDKDIARIRGRIEDKAKWILVKRKVDPETAEQAAALKVKGIVLQNENKRYYPQGSLAAHVLGGVGIDDNGLAGVELQKNALLEGEKGRRLYLLDARRISYSFETIKAAKPGTDLYLTIDETIQYIAESELEKAIASCGAAWGTVVIASPFTGEILAVANRPTYDPNDFPPEPAEAGRNLAIQNTFEPGSTFKIVTAAAARELAGIGLGETYDCRKGAIVVGGSPVKDHKLLGILSFPEVLIESSNVGTIMVAQEMGEEKLYRMIKILRFGERTGIDLPGEEYGICRPLSAWSRSSLRIAIGYEINVTALQILRAMNVYATGGLLVRPRITRESTDGLPVAGASSDVPARVLSEKTASELTAIFKRVVEDGTGQPARLDGFDIAGKTGTAQKFDPSIGAYSSALHRASFVGFVPADNPVLTMIVVLDEPKGIQQYGGQVAAPVFRDIAARVLRYLRAAPKPSPQPLVTARMEKAHRP
jgi:cell division protein FtsI/penicillin-binding protein 2